MIPLAYCCKGRLILYLIFLFLGQSSVYFRMGLLAAKQRRCEDAESLFRKSLEMREDWYGSSHPLVAEIYDALASLSCSDAAESPDVTVAEEMFRCALSMREDLLGPSHLLVANTLFKLGQYWECFDIACKTEGIA